MVFGHLRDIQEFSWLEKGVQEALEYARIHDLLSYDTGCHEIDGDRLFVNVVEYETTTPENRFWEAHREYLDLHVMLQGNEQIDVSFIDDMEQKEYVPKDDFLPLEGEPACHAIMREGNFLLCYPKDGHRTAVAVNGPEKVKKVIFKIKIQ